MLHALNHGLFKGLLFQAAGAAATRAGSRDLEKLGGLMRRITGFDCLHRCTGLFLSLRADK
jgi:formate hydrogenlyase subunit 3/multisubunit Na+/H+ antiporter MnhD subunit